MFMANFCFILSVACWQAPQVRSAAGLAFLATLDTANANQPSSGKLLVLFFVRVL